MNFAERTLARAHSARPEINRAKIFLKFFEMCKTAEIRAKSEDIIRTSSPKYHE